MALAYTVNATPSNSSAHPSHPPATERRCFLKSLAAAGLGGTALLAPVAVGLRAFLDPWRGAEGGEGIPVRVTALAALPNDGVPRRFTVVADRTNAWNRTDNVPIGAVYLQRTGEEEVKAFNVVCPHAGCYVEYSSSPSGFLCPCHDSMFALDGSVNDPKSPSPRGLDELPVEVRDGGVWVGFRNFRPGVAEKVPV